MCDWSCPLDWWVCYSVVTLQWLTVSLCVPFPHTPRQESEFQETASDRSDDRETEDGGLSGTDKNRSFLLFFSSAPFSASSSSTLELLGTDLKVEKKKKGSDCSCHLLRGEKNNFDFYAERNIFIKRIALCVWGDDRVRTVVPPVCQRVTEKEFLFHNVSVYEWLGGLYLSV